MMIIAIVSANGYVNGDVKIILLPGGGSFLVRANHKLLVPYDASLLVRYQWILDNEYHSYGVK